MVERVGGRKPPRKKRRPEATVLASWSECIQAYARRAHYPHRMNMTIADVEQELAATLLLFRRSWYEDHKAEPDDALIRHALGWRVKKINRDCRAKFRESLDADAHLGDLDMVSIEPDDLIEQEDRELACRTLFYGLRDKLPHDQLSLLWLRHGEGLLPAEIGDLVGMDSRDVSRKVYQAKVSARDFLTTLGIKDWDDVLSHCPEELLK